MRTFIVTLAATVIVVSVSAAADPHGIACARVFPNAGQLGLFIAAADGRDEHPLLTDRDLDYDPVWAPDGASIVFTSDRQGSADLFQVKPDGSALEQITDDPAYDD
jgi:TolB protein